MPTKILMPALSPTMSEGNLVKWHKKEGDTVESGEVIAEIETDKATMEVEAVDEGVLSKIVVAEGSENVPVNSTIAYILEEGESEGDLSSVEDDAPVPQEQEKETTEKNIPKEAPQHPKKDPPLDEHKDRIFASPLARRIAQHGGIDLQDVKGSGPRGRIIKDDVEKYRSQVPEKKGQGVQTADIPHIDKLYPDYETIKNNNVRKVTAQRLTESKQTIPHFYLTVSCQLDCLLRARKDINDNLEDGKISVNDLVIKAVAQALLDVPAANSSWGGDFIRRYKRPDISIAVATDNGLMTPIVKDAASKGLGTISKEVKDLARRARENKLRPDEFQGGTFTISNLGMFGIEDFKAILNPPQACILAVGAGVQKPYVQQGELGVATVMKATLSVDHRAVDGAEGAQLLQAFKKYIENPMLLLT